MKNKEIQNIAIISNDIEDNRVLSHVLQEQYSVTEYTKLEKFLDDFESSVVVNYNLVILDYNGTKNSSDIIRIRDASNQEDNPLLILVLSTSDNSTDKIECLDCGADEYILKPYSSPELMSKINALIRRYSYGEDAQKEHEYTYKNISLNEWTREVKVSGRKIKLTRKEYQFLLTLIKAPDYPVSRDRLFGILWNYDGYRSMSDEANLNTHASSLRRKIKLVDPVAAKLIVTEKCYGYKLGVC